MSSCWRAITRKKVLDPNQTEQTQLARVLNTFDLTALGVGSTLGVGVYVLAGHVARDTAGPSVVLSFFIAAIASVFAGLCYAEFGARTPKAGSAYIYSYVSIGELVAFIIGWNLILEYVIGSASVARGLSVYLDTLINNTMQDCFREITPINVNYMSSYFDFFAFGLSVFLAVALAFGLRESSIINNIVTSLNIGVVLFVIIAGSIKANPENWKVASNTSDPSIENGGFFPFGIEGMIKGAATCFYGFVGFDCIATTGEEVKNPQKAIPIAIISSLAIIFLAYFGTATVITMMVPYYLQDINAPIPHAFEEVGWSVAKWIVAVGGMFGLFASLFGALFPLPRIIYAMASDGIIFKFLGKVNARFKTPVVGTLLAGLLTGLMAALFELKQLVSMMSIGTLLAYTLVAACVLILRYQRDEESFQNIAPPLEGYTENQNFERSSENLVSQDDSILIFQKVTFSGFMKQIFNIHDIKFPTKTSELLVSIEVFLFCVFSLLLGMCAIYLINPISHGKLWAIILTSIVGLFLLLLLLSLSLQPVSHKELRFKVPLVPLIPALSIVINVYLMLMLDAVTWIRFAVWMAVGMPMYFISIFSCSSDANQFSVKYANNLTHVETNHNSNKQNGYVNKNFAIEEEKPEMLKTNGGTVGLYIQNGDAKIYENYVRGESFVKKRIKPKAPSPPSPSHEEKSVEQNLFVKKENTNNSETTSVSHVLAILDEIILKEEENQETLSNHEDEKASETTLERNSSFDSVSLASNIYREESVVALVHQEDTNSIKVENEEGSLKVTLENESESNDSNIENKLAESNENVPAVEIKTDENEIQKVKEQLQEIEYPTIADIPNKVNEENEPLNIPPPPPLNMELFEKDFKTVPRIPRVTIKHESSFSTVSTVKSQENKVNVEELADEIQKRNLVNSSKENITIKIPPVDYDNLEMISNGTADENSNENSKIDDNVTFGSEQHRNISSKLEKLFSQTLGIPPPKKLTKPEIPQENDINVTSPYTSLEYDDQTPIEQLPVFKRGTTKSSDEEVDFKTRLSDILLRRSVRPSSETHVNGLVVQPKKDIVENETKEPLQNGQIKNENYVSEQIMHREKMNDAFKSIRLRKVDSFKNT
ncbi:high affinity cationic amino acid transporter 1 [Agrilus planipennis]|uniref:High affinity cationic amino acid transporter 1 n=1 Tax=Agrilus planipennis TaxID=224129 RepID=A0A1W4WJL5_AGRPL|nr:high affinity cationic amino acid transporter 1 [Agrilus planipennis]